LEGFGEQFVRGVYALASTGFECATGAGTAEETAEPAQPFIGAIPGADVIAEAAIPLIGCAIGAVSAKKLDYNLLG
jgi:hypothetical protein